MTEARHVFATGSIPAPEIFVSVTVTVFDPLTQACDTTSPDSSAADHPRATVGVLVVTAPETVIVSDAEAPAEILGKSSEADALGWVSSANCVGVPASREILSFRIPANIAASHEDIPSVGS